MAGWYYTRDGAVFGPYSEETMAELIDNGKVAFVTMVWNSDTKDENRGWAYAFDTPLSSYFSDEFTALDLPSPADIDTPPLPLELETGPEETPQIQSMSEVSEQTEPIQSETTPQATNDIETKPLKQRPLIVIFLLLLIIGLMIGVISWLFSL